MCNFSERFVLLRLVRCYNESLAFLSPLTNLNFLIEQDVGLLSGEHLGLNVIDEFHRFVIILVPALVLISFAFLCHTVFTHAWPYVAIVVTFMSRVTLMDYHRVQSVCMILFRKCDILKQVV